MTSLEFKWAERLLEEHRQICAERGIYDLPSPIIIISGSRHNAGSFQDKDNIISISRQLISSRPWHLVVEVLKHEMAHQYVSRVLKTSDGHGPIFEQACCIIGVHPVFMKASGDIEQDLAAITGEMPAAAQQMLAKVEKLMALGRSPNEKEARAASRKARYLLHKYNLEQLEGRSVPGISCKVICHKKKQVKRLQLGILSLLKTWYFVETVITQTYDPLDDDEYKAVTLIGRPENLAVAEHVYHFLLDAAGRLWQQHRRTHSTRRTDRVDFEMGFIKGISDNHETMNEMKPHHGSIAGGKTKTFAVVSRDGLVKMIENENRAELKRLFPRLIKTSGRERMVSAAAFESGFTHGKNTHINKTISGKKSGTMRFLKAPG